MDSDLVEICNTHKTIKVGVTVEDRAPPPSPVDDVKAVAALWQVNFIGLPYASGAYARMAKLGALVWQGPRPAQTPTQYASSLSSAVGLRPGGPGAIAEGFTKSRYSGGEISGQERERVQQSWRAVRAILIRRLVQKADLRQLLRREV